MPTAQDAIALLKPDRRKVEEPFETFEHTRDVKEEERPKEGIFAQARESGLDLVEMGEQLKMGSFTGHKTSQVSPLEGPAS